MDSIDSNIGRSIEQREIFGEKSKNASPAKGSIAYHQSRVEFFSALLDRSNWNDVERQNLANARDKHSEILKKLQPSNHDSDSSSSTGGNGLTGGTLPRNSGNRSREMSGISFEDAQALLQQLQNFRDTIAEDWHSVLSQWENLRNLWHDRQYDRFYPFFEQLSQTYSQADKQCEAYIQFLAGRIRASEEAAATLNI
ncbi:MAG: hypothetical protein MUC48_10635 [Leptolyngbya sp. Prado105]|jgi:hypothetical protein|nr:hypothetical protein [Leptolyngbya sp. Prado105]